MKARFDELLPFYVNGTLAEADRSWVEQYLNEHPQAASELTWYQSLQTKLREDVPAVSSEVGMERALARIRTEGPAPRAARPPLKRTSWGDRIRDVLASFVPQPVLRPALAGALAVVAVQAVVIANLATDDETTQLRAVRSSVTEQGPYLKVNFRADAREADIRLLLVEMNATLAGGPGQLGDWYVRVPAAQAPVLMQKAKASAIVEAVQLVDGLPARQ